MAIKSDFFSWVCPPEKITTARHNAAIRIANGEYARDSRLNDEERTSKIVTGYLGEYGFQYWCRHKEIAIQYLGEAVGNGPDNGDFKTVTGLTIDVKTQETAYLPQPDWRCEVTDEQLHRPVTIYVFCKLRTINSICTLYLVGWEYEADFKQRAIYRKRGDILRGKPVHYPKWDITIEELKPMSDLVKAIRR